MTKLEIQTALDNVPSNLRDGGPSELKAHFETIERISPDEVNSLIALHLVKHLGGLEHLKDNPTPWQIIRGKLQSKYSELGPGHPLWYTLEIASIAMTREKIVIIFS